MECLTKSKRLDFLRHTFATLMLDQNQSLKIVSELLGHTTIKTTADIYSHALVSTKRKANTVIDTLLFGDK
ncbi:tyrosine-type recombinase/integrase [Clostridium estertheticum]|uniref:tyrosine-type recombinase/integrase n=1 Tax=Clostridium estertheticum TaxID=238834 RepID=UPI00299E5099|nr:tyrosine-type recombinase/integrase [Clostridium estertheticum]